MEKRFTPGPWKVRYLRVDDPEQGFFVEAQKTNPNAGYDIEILCDGDANYPWEQKLADAKLVSAAPDLLMALEQSHNLLKLIKPAWIDWPEWELFSMENEAAIKKAYGL